MTDNLKMSQTELFCSILNSTEPNQHGWLGAKTQLPTYILHTQWSKQNLTK